MLEAWTRPSSHNHFGAVIDGELVLLCVALVRGISKSRAAKKPGGSEKFAEVEIEEEEFLVTLDCLGEISFRGMVYLLPVVEKSRTTLASRV